MVIVTGVLTTAQTAANSIIAGYGYTGVGTNGYQKYLAANKRVF